jgi:TolA-binding protein
MRVHIWRKLGKPLLLGGGIFFFMAVQQGGAAEPSPATGKAIEQARSELQKWVETEQILSKEKQEWKLGQQILQDRIDLLEGEIKDLEQKIKESKQAIVDADKKRESTVNDNKNLKNASEALAGMIGKLEAQIKDQLLVKLPQTLQDKLGPLTQRLPAHAKETKLSLAQRFQNVVGILNEINKFNGTITTATAVRAIDGGLEAEVKEIYLGLGHAYYVNGTGDKAAVGRPGARGWEWTAVNDRAPEISQIFRILADEQVPDFVPLPVKMD